MRPDRRSLHNPGMTYVRNSGIIFSAIDREVLALDDGGKFFTFNETTAAIWQYLEAPRTLPAICSHLADLYDGDPAEIEADAGEVINRLVSNDLILRHQK